MIVGWMDSSSVLATRLKHKLYSNKRLSATRVLADIRQPPDACLPQA